MPPLCITTEQINLAIEALEKAILEVCGQESVPNNQRGTPLT
jgi:adenosylmethionine-8-amino-7-oxononanoate aminotransferase